MNTELMEKVAEVSPETYQFMITTAPAIRTSPFRDEIVGELDGIIKQAGVMGGVGRQIGVNVGAGIAMALAGDMYSALKRGITKSTYYKNMLEADPSLKELESKDVQNAFNTLHQFAPEFSSNPQVAAAYVKKNAQFPEFDITQLQGLVGATKNISDTKKLPSSHIDIGNFERGNDSTEKGLRETQTAKMKQEMKQDEELHPLRREKAERDVHGPSAMKQLERLQQHSGMAAKARARR